MFEKGDKKNHDNFSKEDPKYDQHDRKKAKVIIVVSKVRSLSDTERRMFVKYVGNFSSSRSARMVRKGTLLLCRSTSRECHVVEVVELACQTQLRSG